MSNSTTAPLWPLENASPIIWNAADRSFILSAFFYGYVILQVCSHSIRFIRCPSNVHMKSQIHGSACFENQSYSLDTGSRREDGGDVRNKEGAWIQVFFGLVETFKESTHCKNHSMLVTAILGLLAPLAAYTSYYFIFAILVAQVVFSQINFFWLQMVCIFIIISYLGSV